MSLEKRIVAKFYTICLLLFAYIFFLFTTTLFSTTALAGGWIQITTDTSLTPGQPSVGSNTDEGTMGYWLENTAGGPADVPHLGLQTSTNQCRVCHAVHNGASDGFKLLRNNSRAEECNFCHGPNGALTQNRKKPYAPMIDLNGQEVPAKGEHTLGATVIPDSTVDAGLSNIATDGLQCGTCHSVHGASTIYLDPDPNTEPNWDAIALYTKILRLDPARNGLGIRDNGAIGGVINVQEQGNGNKPILGPDTNEPAFGITKGQVMAAFCGDCHNKNVNWDRGAGTPGAPAEGERPNKYAHPMGWVDEYVDVYGQLKLVASEAVPKPVTCPTCHVSRDSQTSKFPHQSQGHKLLADSYTNTSSYLDNGGSGGYTGDPERPLPNLDGGVCRSCHFFIGKPDDPMSF